VEGPYTHIVYQINAGATLASPIQIARNYQNAIKKVGGAVVYERMDGVGGTTTMKLVRGTDEIWAQVGVGDCGFNYVIDVVEKAGMKQEVTANAEVFRDDIRTTGHAAVYGIYFDTDQSVVKPESEPALKEVARLLQADLKLSVRVVGHTDSTGDLAHNVSLSEARARAVVAALTAKHGVAAARLTAHGVGPLAPVASNDTEEGRAKNRRVELVKR
jgi:outer membrane protein OmpA-like peptidoglycan-associated protein